MPDTVGNAVVALASPSTVFTALVVKQAVRASESVPDTVGNAVIALATPSTGCTALVVKQAARASDQQTSAEEDGNLTCSGTSFPVSNCALLERRSIPIRITWWRRHRLGSALGCATGVHLPRRAWTHVSSKPRMIGNPDRYPCAPALAMSALILGILAFSPDGPRA